MSDVPELRERLFKARRLLLTTSVILLAHYALGIQIKSDAESLGLKFELPDIQRVWFGVWIVWTWALVVYLQHCHEFKFDDFPNAHFDKTRYRAIRWFDQRRFLKEARTAGVHGRKGRPDALTLEKGRTQIMNRIQTDFHEVTIIWNANDMGRFQRPQSAPTGFAGYCARIGAWFYVMTTTRFGTDYFAPMLIAAATLGYGVHAVLN